MTVVIKSTQYDALKGAWLERGTFTVIPAATGTVTANAELECPLDTQLTCNTGDQLFVNAINLKTGLVCKGARVTATNIAKVLLANVTASNITDSTGNTYDYELVHYS